MWKIILFVLFLTFGRPTGLVSNSSVASLPGTEGNPVSVQIYPRPLLVDKTGRNVVLNRQGAPLDPYSPVVAFDLEARAVAPTPADRENQRLPFDAQRSLEFLKAFRVSAQQVDGLKWAPEQLDVKVIYYQYESASLTARITVQPKGGWPAGNMMVLANFDLNEIRRTMGFHVYVGSTSQAVQLRFTSRAHQGAEDDRMEKRFAILTHFVGTVAKPALTRTAQEDIKALLDQFPDDPWGHAYAGLLAMNGIMGSDKISDRLRVIRENGRTVPDPLLQIKIHEVKEHYGEVLKIIGKALSKEGRETTLGPVERKMTPEYRALGFDSWNGISGPQQLISYFLKELQQLEFLEESLRSGFLLADEDVQDAQAIADFMKRDEPLAKAIRAVMERAVSWRYREGLLSDKALTGDERSITTYALNRLIIHSPLNELLGANVLTLSTARQQLLEQRPKSPSNQVLDNEWSRKFNRSVLEDIFSPHLRRLNQGA